ncbi:hypothetical protein [Gemella haemolysans]|uniref:hypothetical protein n=1 Tax=Gemella haemolysans TaxID=1379 RepID=UPI002915572E|nr:hypothetical protein [Gemella haemolysans]MDU3831585.1 hypothetical protein [Gemella haemolysans]
MNTKFKITAAVLSAGLIITPLSGLVQNNQNVAKASDLVSKKTSSENSIQKHIDYIDSQIYLANNHLIVNKEQVLKYLKQNWNEINKNTKLNTPEEYLNSIELSISNINEKVSSGWYEFDNQKGIKEKYQSRSAQRYEIYEQWWGFQMYAHYQYQVDDLTDDLETAAYAIGAAGGISAFFTGPVGAALGLVGLNYGWMKVKVERTFRDYGSVKLSINKFSSVFWTEPIQ